MEYEIQAYLHSCQAQLSSPQNFEVSELSQFLKMYMHYGVNDFVTSLVQRYFYVNIQNPQLYKYMQLIDKMIKLQFSLPASFVNMFGVCFQASISNGRKSIQEQLKIYRKLWEPVLNDILIHQLRLQVYLITNVDVQLELRDESKKFIRGVYEKSMGLGKREIQRLLGPKVPLGRGNTQQGGYDNAMNMMNMNVNMMNMNMGQQNCNMNVHSQHEQMGRNGTKKQKLSQETEAEESHRNQNIKNPLQKLLLIYNTLRNIHNCVCRECGKSHQTASALKIHQQSHFHQKMKLFQFQNLNENLKKIRNFKQNKKQMNLSEWINQNKNQYQKMCVQVPQIGCQQQIKNMCNFCGNNFAVQMKQDKLVYKGAMMVDADGEDKMWLVHGECYQTLIQDQ